MSGEKSPADSADTRRKKNTKINSNHRKKKSAPICEICGKEKKCPADFADASRKKNTKINSNHGEKI
ncbi:hypothetical protein A9996_12610 [Gelidibacter algens]|nr:hypothetical protein A9996_12610 [Gelidibacter algens]